MEIEVGMYIKSCYVGRHVSYVTAGKEYLIENKIHDHDDTFIVFKDDRGDDHQVGLLPNFRLRGNYYASEFQLGGWEVVPVSKKEVVDTAKYQTINIKGNPTRLPTGDETNLNQEDIFDLIDIALDNRDEEYFNELVERLKKV